MTKKILMFLVVAIGAASIMMVSIWGTLPESQSTPPVDSLVILDYDAVNLSGDKILFVKDVITEQNYMFRIDFTASPGDSDQDGIRAKVDVDGGIQAIASISDHYVTVIFDTDHIGTAVTVTVWDTKTMKQDAVTLLFSTASEVDIDDPDIFE